MPPEVDNELLEAMENLQFQISKLFWALKGTFVAAETNSCVLIRK